MSTSYSAWKTSPRHSVSVAAVVVDHGYVLVIKRADTGEWQIPGGVLELDESIEDGLRREVLEETGLEIRVDQLTGVYKNMKLGTVALVFTATVVGGEAKPTEETQAVSWWTREIVKEHMAEVFAVRVFDALGISDRWDALETGLSATVRTHDGTRLLD